MAGAPNSGIPPLFLAGDTGTAAVYRLANINIYSKWRLPILRFNTQAHKEQSDGKGSQLFQES
jgi:hypothetical protein